MIAICRLTAHAKGTVPFSRLFRRIARMNRPLRRENWDSPPQKKEAAA